jgi:hypothetical protein
MATGTVRLEELHVPKDLPAHYAITPNCEAT